QALRSFLAGPGVIALFDAPWLPAYLVLICLFHPLLGAMALAGAATMVGLAVLNERLTRAPLERSAAQAARGARLLESGLRNAEVIRALGMHGALVRRWARHHDVALGGQLRAAELGAAFS